MKTKILKMLYKLERCLYFRTGIKLPFLKMAWDYRGNRDQEALNKEHGTNIAYGYLKDE